MAQIITQAGDKSLEFDTSQTLFRKMEFGSSVTELRFVMYPYFSSSLTSNQQFVTATLTETFRMGLTDGNILVSGSNYTGIGWGSVVGGTSEFYTGNPGCAVTNTYETYDVSNLTGSFTHVNGSVNSNVNFKKSQTHSVPMFIRMWKSGSLDIYLERREGDTNSTSWTLPISTATAYFDLDTIPGTISAAVTSKYTFTTTQNRDTAFLRLNTFVLSWPYFNFPLRIALMAYKVSY